ncbi:MAG: Long-chain-fatty-acid--CoA ligase [uncultured Rubrobacteraceae bacterium]|uniref:Long-chain-fatty-acid--CoA ligase n=1 Tax=uncultured Rubrobacteraceae bacterium TaxID=349277 RepID=A0A6J4R1J4_9ACTN|nr:MAG: Long-chain-fatty-acid--CoA ligase [uncultured Rubrobacteraceae bacterium]
MPRPEFTLHDLLHNSLERDPRKAAVVDGDAEYSYEDLERESSSLGAALVDAGVNKGDRVGVLVDKSWEAIVSMLAASRIGAAYVNVNPLFKAPQIEYLAADCDIRVMVGDTGKLDELRPKTVETAFYRGEKPEGNAAKSYVDVAEALKGDGLKEDRAVSEIDLGTILYTSGSTGMPKGVATSQRNVVVGAQIVSTYLENTPQDRILSALPLNFDAGMSQFTTSLRVGATLYLLRSRLPGDLLKGLRRHEITGVTGVPPLWALLLRGAKSLRENPMAHLRYLANTGGRIPQANLDELRNLLEPAGTKIYLMYGLTEAFRSTYLDPREIHRSSPEQGNCIGKAIPDTEIMVITKEGKEAAPGEPGELVHRGPTVAMGYWGNEEATAKAYRPNPLAPPELLGVERVVYSGDTVTRDEEGYLYFLGREDAMIKNQGYRLSPEEVENLLLGSGLVHEACAFGVENPAVGHDVVAVISLKDGGGDGAIDSVREYAIKNGPPYMIPKEIIVRDELPKNANGKIDRKGISNAYTNG